MNKWRLFAPAEDWLHPIEIEESVLPLRATLGERLGLRVGQLYGPHYVASTDVAGAYNDVQNLFYGLMVEHGVGFFNERTADEC